MDVLLYGYTGSGECVDHIGALQAGSVVLHVERVERGRETELLNSVDPVGGGEIGKCAVVERLLEAETDLNSGHSSTITRRGNACKNT